MATTSAKNTSGYKQYDNNICHKNIYKLTYHLSTINQKLLLAKISKLYYKDNIPHIPSKVGVLGSITISHTPEEAMPVGLAKACVL